VKKLNYFALAVLILISTLAYSEPTSQPVKISFIRPYAGDLVLLGAYITPGNFCQTSLYSINIGTSAGKAQYSLALAALLAGNYVQLELVSGACGGSLPSYNALQPITILP
jgi:hypothetical protein